RRWRGSPSSASILRRVITSRNPNSWAARSRRNGKPLYLDERMNERMNVPGGGRRGERYVLGADVGGTRTTFALAAQDALPRIAAQHAYPSQDFTSLGDILAAFVSRPDVAKHYDSIAGACFSVAGPVANNAGKLTNLGWHTDGATLARDFKLPGVTLVNDFSAAAMGITALGPSDIETLQEGTPVA